MSEAVLEEGRLRPFKNSAYEFKLQVAKAAENGDPELLWIRIGSHPQRCLCVGGGPDGTLRFENWLSPAAQEPLWRIFYVDAQESADISTAFPAMCFLQSVKTGQFLSVLKGVPTLQPDPSMWGFVRLRNASTPGRVLRGSTIGVGAGMTVAAAGTVGVAAALTVGAAAKTGRAVAATGVAVTGAGTAVSHVAAVTSGATITKAVAAVIAIPGAVVSAIANGNLAVGAAAAAATPIVYGLAGTCCGVAIGTGGTVVAGVATLMNSARDQSLYVAGYPFVPRAFSKSLSKLSTCTFNEDENPIPQTISSAHNGNKYRSAHMLKGA